MVEVVEPVRLAGVQIQCRLPALQRRFSMKQSRW